MKLLSIQDVQVLEEELLIMSALGGFNGNLELRAKEIIKELNEGYITNRKFKLELIQGGK